MFLFTILFHIQPEIAEVRESRLLWGEVILPGRSVTLLTSSAREVADVVGVRPGGREKQS
jgi:hypothetical protein